MQYFHVSSITAILCNKKIRHKAKAETKFCKSTWHPSKGPAKYSCFRSRSLKQVNSCNPKFQGLGAKKNNLNLLRNLVIGLFWKKLVILMGFRCPELGVDMSHDDMMSGNAVVLYVPLTLSSFFQIISPVPGWEALLSLNPLDIYLSNMPVLFSLKANIWLRNKRQKKSINPVVQRYCNKHHGNVSQLHMS